MPAELSSHEVLLGNEDTLIPEEERFAIDVDLGYAAVLRCVAQARNIARKDEGRAFNANSWQPTPAALERLDTSDADRLARLMAMSQNATEFRQHIAELPLRNYQVEPFEGILDTISFSVPRSREILHAAVERSVGGAFAEMPPGFGKTLDIVYGCVAVGVGQIPAERPDARPLRALVLVPSRRVRAQTLGQYPDDVPIKNTKKEESEDEEGEDTAEDVLRGFGGFAPDIDVATYNSRMSIERQAKGAVIMTYHAFREAVFKGKISDADFDIVFADEAHYLLGKQTRHARQIFCRGGRIPVYGVTGSGDYGEARPLTDVLRYKICDLDFREKIEEQILPPLQLIRVNTSASIRAARSKGDYRPAELRNLAHNEVRNKRIIDWVVHFAERGQHVFVPCIRGDNAWHAFHLAEMANNLIDAEKTKPRMIYDNNLDEYRPFQAAAISSKLSVTQQEEIIAAWQAGEFDALFTVGMLGVGFDSNIIDVVVDGAPTRSKVVIEQRVGRLTRPNDRWPVKVYLTLLDEVQGHKPQYTAWHALHEDYIDFDTIIGNIEKWRKYRQLAQQSKTSTSDGRVIKDDLPDHLIETLGEEYVLIEEVTIGTRANAYAPPKEDYVPLADYPELWSFTDLNSICRLLARNGYLYEMAKGRKGPMRHIHKDAITFLQNYKLPDTAPMEYDSEITAAEKVGVSGKKFRALAEELGIQPQDFRTRKMHAFRPHYKAEDIRRIKRHYKKQQTFDPGDVPISQIAREASLSVTSVIMKMTGVVPPIVGKRRTLPSGKPGIVVESKDAAFLRRHFAETLITPENGRHTIQMMAQKSGRDRSAVKVAIKGEGLDSRLQNGRFKNAETGVFEWGKFLELGEAELVLARLAGSTKSRLAPRQEKAEVIGRSRATASNTQKDWAEISEVLDTLKCTPEAMKVLLARTATNSDYQYNDRHQIRAVKTTVIDHMLSLPIESAPIGWVSHDQLMKALSAYGQTDVPKVGLTSDNRRLARSDDTQVLDIYYQGDAAKRIVATARAKSQPPLSQN